MAKHRPGIGGYQDGPDTLGRDRHRIALIRLMKEAGERDFGDLRPYFFFDSEGLFSADLRKRPLKEGVGQVVIYRDGHASATIGIVSDMYNLPEVEFRLKLASYMRDASVALVRHASKKRAYFKGEEFLDYIENVLTLYLALPLPLPPTMGELEYARKWLGVPAEPK